MISTRVVIHLLITLTVACAFQSLVVIPSASRRPSSCLFMSAGRRSFLALVPAAVLSLAPQPSLAGIDVSGLQVDGRGGSSTIANQLKGYDGSGSARVKELKSIQEPTVARAPSAVSTPSNTNDDVVGVATWAYRSSGFGPRISRISPLFSSYEDTVDAPKQSKRRALPVSFNFPSDWLALDKISGGIQYVDQRNGDKLYVLRVKLPEGEDLATIPKAWFGKAIFDPQGSIVKSGTTIDDFRVSASTIVAQCPNNLCATRRRLTIKYATVTGNGLRVERRALVDAIQVENDVYMLMTSSNAVKFDAKGRERDTVDKIVESFFVEA